MLSNTYSKQQAPIKMAIRTPKLWFARMRHQLRHRFGKRIIKELDWLSKSARRLSRFCAKIA